ncbi:MAG: hypothetical protein JWQ34_4 [Mucilaginibacter sp.]|uniref:hypothetical protein n=1 Tax=Mucilaginibacter sp. TaxID=1882438 RepID=UPI0026127DDD|nr:hypothetical protein [Mucilaginibacter sp.]MDB5001779.1 hypothetical protein [Mucilaginibacter sp.]
MKFLAVLQIVCILFLSAFQGMAKPVAAQTVKFDCCKKLNAKSACRHKKSDQKDDCTGLNCNMLLICGIGGFLAIEPLAIKPALAISLDKPVQLYKIGNSTGHLSANWKPPKV